MINLECLTQNIRTQHRKQASYGVVFCIDEQDLKVVWIHSENIKKLQM